MAGTIALVTGANKGIGKEICGTVSGRPPKSDSTVMLPMKAVFADGREFSNTIPAGDR
jgi:hypothetical protein